MNRFIYVFFLLSLTIFGQLSASNESIDEGFNSDGKSLYQRHLPPDIFKYLIKNNLVDELSLKKTTEKQNLEGLDSITVSLNSRENESYVLIYYYSGNRSEKYNFGGVQLAYQKGKAVGYAIFDGEGCDYVAPTPLSDENEKKAITMILLLMEGGIEKLVQE